MDESETFRANLLLAMREAGMNAAELSRKAGLNSRAVKDIEERRTRSPKLSTVFALSYALGRDPGFMIGIGPRAQLSQNLVHFLEQYDEETQEQILRGLAAVHLKP